MALSRRLTRVLSRSSVPLLFPRKPASSATRRTLAPIDHAKLRTNPGSDDVACEIFENVDSTALQWLTRSLNAIWISGAMPASWKHAEVMSTQKAGKPPNRLTHLRPIALTSTLCKLLECTVARRLS